VGINNRLKTPCTIIQRVDTGERDRHGDPVYETVETETRCALQKVSGREHEDGGETSDTTWRAWFPWGTALDTGAAVEAKGRRYEVVGDVWDADEGSRSLWHVEATLERTSGPSTGVGS
jgi:SPP1 family predicted phage head-tail adaptor